MYVIACATDGMTFSSTSFCVRSFGSIRPALAPLPIASCGEENTSAPRPAGPSVMSFPTVSMDGTTSTLTLTP
ncbi:hypothetical protein OMP40_12875 [Cohnella rhizosphaerae]|uniref:Uncharacterized protein n=1 Tax=Cohnella rhizosphaerae TaxID=1457232 RepID=A0A9X4KSN9_9BACL|nr:hypothetical protein [Cohnella rhizosphaerae]MDG0810140.1 hypothetical protein [Cohnella rhizosphaerae]